MVYYIEPFNTALRWKTVYEKWDKLLLISDYSGTLFKILSSILRPLLEPLKINSLCKFSDLHSGVPDLNPVI